MDQQFNNKMVVRVANDTPTSRRVALTRAFFDALTIAADGAGFKPVYNNVAELNKAGFPCVAVAFDGSYPNVEGDKGIIFSSGDPNVSIEAFHRYLLQYKLAVTSIDVVVNNQNAFGADLILTKASPLGNGRTIKMPLKQYFKADQFQSDRVSIPFTKDKLVMGDDLVLEVITTPQSWLEFTFNFE